jgi:hypothetical protein
VCLAGSLRARNSLYKRLLDKEKTPLKEGTQFYKKIRNNENKF